MNRRSSDTRLGRAMEDVRRWALVVLIVLVVVLGYYTSHLTRSVDDIDGSVKRIEQSSTRTEAAAAELVAFVHEVQAQSSATSGGQSQAVQMILSVLCASSDPVRQKACADLTRPGG